MAQIPVSPQVPTSSLVLLIITISIIIILFSLLSSVRGRDRPGTPRPSITPSARCAIQCSKGIRVRPGIPEQILSRGPPRVPLVQNAFQLSTGSLIDNQPANHPINQPTSSLIYVP